ncbi:MAG: hypothetical protein KC933_21200, partial [Myxococcales bacterium]|nr:hypothetical protein [Myxococcales bacterium]
MSTSTVLSGMALCMVAAFGSGCGAALQYAYGFDEQVTRPAKRTRAVRIEGLPAGAEVERYDAEGAHPLEDPTHDLVEYDVVETVAVPRSRVPMFIGSALDAAALAGTLYLGLEHDRSGIVKYYVSYPASSLVADLAFAIIYSRDREPRVERYAPAPTEPVAYVARVGDTLYEAQVDVAWSDRVVFDDEHRVEPGAPRIALPQPPAPRPEVSIDPHTKPPSTWYGWQLLPIDAGAAALVVVGIQQDETAMIVGGAALAGLAPALVHLGNGEGRNAASSLGLRLGV